MNNLINILLRAEIDPNSINRIKDQIDDIQKNAKSTTINVSAPNAKKLTDQFKDLNNSLATMGRFDLSNTPIHEGMKIVGYSIKETDEGIIKFTQSLNDGKNNILTYNGELNTTANQYEVLSKSVRQATRENLTFWKELKIAVSRTLSWGLATGSVYKTLREIKDGVGFIKEMDAAITEIGIVTNQTREQTSGLIREYNDLAKQMRVTTREITSGAVEFYRQGLDTAEVMERLEATTRYSKIANLEFAQSAEVLTATVNSMGIDIERASDVFTYLGDATATGADEIGVAFSKTGGSAAALGVEFEKVASWIAVISSRTRESAQSIGHSINTMLSRMSRITSTGFNEDDDTKLNDVAKALDSIGISLTDSEGNFRDFGIIMDEVGSKFGNLNDKQKAYLASTLAGTRQQSRFYNLMEGYADSVKLYTESLDSANTSLEKYNIYMESNQAIMDKFQATKEGFWANFLDSDTLRDFTLVGIEAVEILDTWINDLGLLGTAFGAVIPIIGVYYVNALRKKIQTEITAKLTAIALADSNNVLGNSTMTIAGGFKAIGVYLVNAIKSMVDIKVATDATTVSFIGLNAAAGLIGIALVGITLGVNAYINAERKRKEAMEESIQTSKKLADEVKILDDLRKKQKELSEVENASTEQKEELLEVQRKLAQLFPELASGLDEEGNKIAENTELTNKLTEAKKKQLEQELLNIKTIAQNQLPILKEQLKKLQEENDKIQADLVAGNTKKTIMARGQAFEIDKSGDMARRSQELIASISKLAEEIRGHEDAIKQSDIMTKEKLITDLKLQASNARTAAQMNAVETRAIEAGLSVEELAEIFSITNEEVEGFNNNINNTTKSISDLYKSVSTAVDEYDLFNQALKELNEEGSVSKSTLDKLLAVYPNIIELTGLQKDAMISLMNTSKDKRRQMIDDEIATAKANSEATVQKILDVQNYADALTKLAQLKAGMALFDAGASTGDTALDARLQADYSRAKEALAIIESTNKKIQALEGMRSLFDRSDKSNTKTTSAKEQYKAEADRYAQINLLLDKNNVLLERNKTLQSLAGDDLAKKIPLMEEQIKLEKEQQDLLHQKANIYRQEVLELEKSLSGQGFQFQGQGDNRIITNLDHIKGKTKEVEEQFKRYIDLQSNLLPRASLEWGNLEKSIIETGISIEQVVQKYTKEMIELEKRNAYMDLELRQREAQAQLDRAKAKLERDVDRLQGRIDRLQDEIDDIQESERARQENLERARRLEEISKLQNKYYYLQYVNLENITEEQAKAVGLEKEREKHLERQAKIQELLIKLENIRNEKNIQQLTKLEDGSWDFTYVADQREIDNINKQVEDLQKEHSQSLKDLKESTLENLKKAQEDYDEWEYQNDIRRQIEAKQRRIKEYQDEIKDLQEKYANKEKLTNEAFAREKENLDRYYMDMDKLTDEKMKQLHETFGENWSNIYDTLKGFFDKIGNDYDELVDKLSKPLPTPSGSGGGQSYYTPPSGSGGGGIAQPTSGGTGGSGGGTSSGSGSTTWSTVAGGYVDKSGKVVDTNPRFDKNGKFIDKYHDGGIVGNGSSRDLPNIINKLFNLKPNEQIVKALKGELMIPEDNIVKNFLPNMRDLINSITPNIVMPKIPQSAIAGTGGDTIYYVNELSVPNATDFDSFIKGFTQEINNYPNKTIMKVKKIGKI